MSYVIYLKILEKYRSQEPCVSKQKQTSVWESSIETVRHEVQNRERVRAKTDKEAFKYIKVQEQFENFQRVQKFLLEIDNNPSDFLKSSGGCWWFWFDGPCLLWERTTFKQKWIVYLCPFMYLSVCVFVLQKIWETK